MYGIKFTDKDTLKDFGLILTDVQISAPKPKRETVDIPYHDGLVDVTKALSESVKYERRTLTFEFAFPGNVKEAEKIKSKVYNHIHGQDHEIIIGSDPDWYWNAYCTVENMDTSKNLTKITIECEAEPYKYAIKETTYNLFVNKKLQAVVENARKEVTPTVSTTQIIYIAANGKTIKIDAGKSNPEGFVLKEGINTLAMSSAEPAIVTITYRKGSL